jgi:hypothetical protein
MSPTPKCYFELRKSLRQGNINLAADIMRHLYARQYLGKTIIVCERPALFLPNTHKQWLKLSRAIQRQRANTQNADKILKYTHTITHMQHMRFTGKTPLEAPEADVYFIHRNELAVLPSQCFSAYLAAAIPDENTNALVAQLPADALIIDYAQAAPWRELGIAPKRLLEERVATEWRAAQAFLGNYDIEPQQLFAGPLQNVEAMDNALDTLLGVSHRFLQIASGFNHALELARPLKLSRPARQQYDTFTLLAHRVQALSSASFSQRFLETYNEDDTFFLYDSGRFNWRSDIGFESLTEASAGRRHLALALQTNALQQAR